jgi:hypothetical protein
MLTAAILFGIAALGGVTMVVMRLQGKPLPPLWLAAIHGVLAASALIMLVMTIAEGAAPKAAVIAAVGFGLAALGGAFLLVGFHLKEKALPIPIMLTHGIVAAISFIILLTAIFGT